MAEIKSTLELVMERTRHLQMTEEDKNRRAEEEFREAVRGLVSKRLDGQIGGDRFQTELNRLGERDNGPKMRAAAEIAARIDPLTDNSPLLGLMEQELGIDVSGLEATLRDFGEQLHGEENRTVERTRAHLLKKGISGLAVIPNAEADREWLERRGEMVETVNKELVARAARLSRRA
ncbi:MAG: hypothetical protein P4L55_16685 [Syntrophobacteraceae bacterium]|nr:hypothetical protein [Syntrophobacteraceae bacterium]